MTSNSVLERIQAAADAMPMDAEQDFMSELLKLRISVHDSYPPEICMLASQGVGFFAKGDIHAIKAKQKQGKTWLIAICVAAILRGQWGTLTSDQLKAKILVIDTEQKKADTLNVYKKTLQMAGLTEEDDFGRIETFALRSLSREQKMQAVERLVVECQPDIVFIDGIVDLMGNFNEVEDSMAIIDRLMQLSTPEVSGKEIAVVCVLHTNKSSEDHNMRGHAGTMLAQKAGTVIEVSKKDGIISVNNTDSRHREFPTWSFRFDQEGNICDATEDFQAQQKAREQAKQQRALQKKAEIEAEREQMVLDILKEANGSIRKKDLAERLGQRLGKGRSTVYETINGCIPTLIHEDQHHMLVLSENVKDNSQQMLPL